MNYLMKFRLAIKSLLLIAILAVTSVLVFGKEIPKQPVPFMLVNDYANVLNSQEKSELERNLRLYNDSSSTQIAVVIEKSLEGEDPFDYSHRIAEAWGIGLKGKDNGVLIYVAMDEKKVYIQVGYGLEGVITDAAAKKIIDDYIKPAFKAGNYFVGLNEASGILYDLSKSEYSAQQFVGKQAHNKFPFVFFILILIFAFYMLRNTGIMGGLIMGSMWSSFAGGSGTFSGNNSSFGGGSFGGGSFGGGGAGGSW